MGDQPVILVHDLEQAFALVDEDMVAGGSLASTFSLTNQARYSGFSGEP
jgi:hypothetical protein